MNPLALTRVLQLASQALPIGGYSYSQGLESGIDAGIVSDEASVLRWILDVIEFSLGSYEIPMLMQMSAAWNASDQACVRRLNGEFIATRESAEIRAASVQMGFSLRALVNVLPDVAVFVTDTLRSMRDPALPCVWSALANAWQIDACDSATAYLWSWVENQVLVAVKTLPMGQSAGQRILVACGAAVAQRAQHGWVVDETAHSNFTPGLAILCAQHETQYSRLFRS